MSTNTIAHPRGTTPRRRNPIILAATAITGLAIAFSALFAIKANDSPRSVSVPVPPLSAPVLPVDVKPLYTEPARQLVVVSSFEEISNARTLPGVELPGVITEYFVVNDEVSEQALAEMERFNGVPGIPTMSILDLR